MADNFYEYTSSVKELDRQALEKAHKMHQKERIVKVGEKLWICVPKSKTKKEIKEIVEKYQAERL